MIWWHTSIMVIGIILLWKVVETMIFHLLTEKKLPYEIQRSSINGVDNIDIKFKKQTSLSISGDVELLINGDVFLINNGRFCVLSRDSIYLDSKQLFLQCRKNPLLKKYKNIRREIEKNDIYLTEIDKNKE